MDSMTITLLVVVGLWILANFKTSRPDGTLCKKVHPYRKLMPYIMPTRNESVVYFDSYTRAEALEEYLTEAGPKLEANITHCLVAAISIGLSKHPRLNRFIMGRRLYARKSRWLTFSVKRKKLNSESKLSAVKMEMKDGETFAELVDRINGQISHERSGEKTHADKEYDLFNLLPRPLIKAAQVLVRVLDYYNLLPAFFIRDDGMYTSIFIANLGSLGMAPGYHHLYEWGNSPLFCMVGCIEDKVIVEDGEMVVRRVLHTRWSYDERIDDGLTAHHGIQTVTEILENPRDYFGCLAEDGSDTKPLV